MRSIWCDVPRPRFPALHGERQTDVLIVGGGMAGLLCGYMLTRAGVDCVIAEAGELCGGVSQNTTAKITAQHGAIYDKMTRRFGVQTARRYWRANEAAIARYAALCREIDCDFSRCDTAVYSLGDRRKIEREVAALRAIGCEATFESSLPLPFSVAGAVTVPHQAQFHPLKFAFAIARDLPIYEHTKVTALTPRGARTERGFIRAKRVVVATHFPFLNTHGAYFLKLYQHRSYVLALRGAPPVGGAFVDGAGDGLSFRDCGDLLLLGGGGHRTGKQGGSFSELRRFAAKNYPQASEVAHWATQDCKTPDDIPYIGQYSSATPHLYVATGFNKWGMTSSMVAAELLCDLLQGRQNPLAAVFSPSRSILRGQVFVNAAESVLGLLTPTVPRCPHLGCALHYNRQEHSWDCSCHGSRFSEDGTRLNGPATGDKRM